ncbi:hypothetical protein ACF0H5_001243 [Mactra antiquata]
MVLSDTSEGDIGWKKWFIAGWAFMECLFFGGLLYGWASVNFVLKMEGIYGCDSVLISNNSLTYSQNSSGNDVISVVSFNGTEAPSLVTMDSVPATSLNDTMEESDGSCKQQDSNMALCFTIASTLFCVGCAVLGHINYKFGTRVTRIISFFMFVIGSLMMAFISKENPWLMYPGLSCLGIGGLPLLVTNTQVSNLFLVGSSSIVGLLCGGFDMSSAVMLIVKLAYQGGFSRQYMFIIIAVLHVLVLVSTFFFLPKDYIVRPEVKTERQSEVAGEEEVGIELINKTNDAVAEQSANDVPSLRSCLLDPKFITHNIWLCLLQLRFYYFIGTLNQYLTRILKTQDQVSYFLDVCMYTMMVGLLTSFLSGIVYDWQKSLCKDGKSHTYREVMPAVLPLTIASTLSLLLSILVLIPVTELLYVSFIVMTVYRSFLYSLAAAFLSAMFPGQYFGMLYGVMILFGGIFSFFQFAFFTWAGSYPTAPQHANICLLCLVLLSYVHPLYLWLTSWKEERKFKVN